ncbi:MAG: chorion class high-cysteine HCB protein 13 [Clostridia bacterium]|nr:chorion class high-cysteine HCB protein 13 [Clostridia bacterium]
MNFFDGFASGGGCGCGGGCCGCNNLWLLLLLCCCGNGANLCDLLPLLLILCCCGGGNKGRDCSCNPGCN